MEDMAEALANHAEIDEAIRLGGAVARDAGGEVDFDEKELEDELEGLVKEETARQEKEAKEKREREEREKEEKERQARELEVQEELERQKALLASLPSPVSPVDPSVDEQWALRYAAGQVEKEIQRKKNLELERRKRAKWELEDSSAS
jgi:charged multivesicular body protein 7